MRPKGTQLELESRRLQGLELLKHGTPPAIVAQLLGVSPRSVRHWTLLVRNSGPDALKLRPTPGRPRKLSLGDENKLRRILLRGARSAGFPSDEWTGRMVAQLIGGLFGVHYHRDHIGRVLRQLGWSLPELNAKIAERRPSSALAVGVDSSRMRKDEVLMPLLRATPRPELAAAVGL